MRQTLFHVGYSQEILLATKELFSDKDKGDMVYKAVWYGWLSIQS